jgi:hypothetical protein
VWEARREDPFSPPTHHIHPLPQYVIYFAPYIAKSDSRVVKLMHHGIRIFNRLPLSLISLKNEKTKFKAALRKYLNTQSFYSVDEFFMYKDGS